MATCAGPGSPGTGTPLPLNEARNPSIAGRKAAALANLQSQGFPVPAGWVVPSELARNLARATIADPASLFIDLPDVPLAVRSSGLTEDGDEESLAGQFATVLNVVGADAVIDAVRTVVESAGASDIAVLIQPMIAPDAAGAAFSANPVTGNRDEIVINAVLGLGDRLMDGAAAAEEWLIRGSASERRAGGQSVLSADTARRIASLARDVEHAAGAPQDIEWALSEDKLFLLQARPITALPVKPDLPPLPDGFWTKELEHFTPPVSPMLYSIHGPNIQEASEAAFEPFGLLVKSLQLEYRAGEIYESDVPLGGEQGPPPPWWVMGALVRVIPSLRKRMNNAARAVRTDLEAQLLQLWHTDWERELQTCSDDLRAINLTALSDRELARHLKRTREFTRRAFEIHFRLAPPCTLPLYRLNRLCTELFGWEEQQTMQLLQGSSTSSSAGSRDLDRIAGMIRQDPVATSIFDDPAVTLKQLDAAVPEIAAAVHQYLQDYGDRMIQNELTGPTFREAPGLILQLLRDRVTGKASARQETVEQSRRAAEDSAETLLAKRSTEERARFEHLLSRARWAYGMREEIAYLTIGYPLALVRYALLETGERLKTQGLLETVQDVFNCYFDEVPAALDGRPDPDLAGAARRRRLETLWTSANPGPASFGTDYGLPDVRGFPPAAREIHEAMFWALERLRAPQASTDGLSGVPASPGRHQGTVRVIRTEQEFPKLQPGDVLVCPSTSSSWAVLFGTAGALVTDQGGSLSHPAIIAREHGIPAVVATGNATQTLTDGQVVIVDGSSGRIELVEAR